MRLSVLLPVPQFAYIDIGICQNIVPKIDQDSVKESAIPRWEIADSSLIGVYPELGYQMVATEEAKYNQRICDTGNVRKHFWATKIFFGQKDV